MTRSYDSYAWTLHYTILIDAQIYTYENLKQAGRRIMHRSSHALSPVESNYSAFNVTKCTVEISHENYYGKTHKKVNTFCVHNVIHNHLQGLFKNIQRNKVNFVKKFVVNYFMVKFIQCIMAKQLAELSHRWISHNTGHSARWQNLTRQRLSTRTFWPEVM